MTRGARESTRPRGRVPALAAVALAALGSCASVQSTEVCPGDECPAELGSVAEDLAATDGVLELVRVTRSSHLEKGSSGGVSVTAEVDSDTEAGPLARRLAEVYLAGDLDPVDRVIIDVLPSPELATRDEQSAWLGGAADQVTDVPCAATDCAAEMRDLRAAIDQEFDGDLRVDGLTWDGDQAPPVTFAECTLVGTSVDQEEINEYQRRLVGVAQQTGAQKWGDIRWRVTFSRSTVFTFAFDGKTGERLP